MSRVAGVQVPIRECIPRVSWDEPKPPEPQKEKDKFSPRERG